MIAPGRSPPRPSGPPQLTPPPPPHHRQHASERSDSAKTTPEPNAGFRYGLPARNVTADTIEDAYVSFIYYCNPGLPANADTAALRESFRTPPKSGGKGFSTFTIFELVKQFYNKEIKTWTELTVKLGVDPPDPTKDESAQKITQYGVRLKKWMNSLHVRSFFEYLMDMPNEYWTRVPEGSDPTAHLVRDGVALEDDMALRALLPQIRPKRGRKRPGEGENTNSPAATRHLSPMSAIDDQGRQVGSGSWPTTGEGHLAPLAGDAPRSAYPGSAHPGSAHPSLAPNDGSQTPHPRWPSSAITPSTRGSFWEDAMEPSSAVTPTGKSGRQRRGAKNVSSAWRPGGNASGAKARGRPPIARTPIEGPGTSFPPQAPSGMADTNRATSPESIGPLPAPNLPTVAEVEAPVTMSLPLQQNRTPTDGRRPARPSISLQVPQRAGGPIRLATPPPTVTIHGPQRMHGPPAGSEESADWEPLAAEAARQYEKGSHASTDAGSRRRKIEDYYFERMEDRTHVDSLMAYFMQVVHEGEWFDAEGNPGERAPMDEVAAIINATLQTIAGAASSPDEFLIRLATLAGAKQLMDTRQRCYRLSYDREYYHYRFEWDYRFGHINGTYNMKQSVPRAMWNKPGVDDPTTDIGQPPPGLSTQEWQQKYRSLLGEMERRDRELSDLKTRMLSNNDDMTYR